MNLREYKPSDCAQLAELFYQTAHSVNAKDYTQEQRNAWATGKVDLAQWDASFREHKTIDAVENSTIVGFGDMDSSGYLDRLYVHKDYQGDRLRNLRRTGSFHAGKADYNARIHYCKAVLPTAGLPNGGGADSCEAGAWFDKFCDGKTVTVEKLYASSCLRTHEAPPFYSRHTERKRHRPRVQGNFQKGY